MIPQRIQRKRAKGFNLQAASLALNGLPCVSVTRPGPYGNPFRIGGYFMVGPGQGKPGFAWLEALGAENADSRFTKIEAAEQAVAMFELYAARYPMKLDGLRGKNIACWCKIGDPCHGDTYVRLLSNPPPSQSGRSV